MGIFVITCFKPKPDKEALLLEADKIETDVQSGELYYFGALVLISTVKEVSV